MSTLEFRVAIRDAIAEEMERDESRGLHGRGHRRPRRRSVFKATPGLHERFGAASVCSTRRSPSSPSPGAAFGAAVTGLRPIVEIMFGDFMALPMDALVNQAAKYWYISNEQASVPLVVRSAVGGGGRFGADPLAEPTAPGSRASRAMKIAMPSDSGRGQRPAQGARSATPTR